MKLPFTFATKLILRLVFPGALYTAIFWPLIQKACELLGVLSSPVVVVPVSIIVLGWLNVLLDMPLYMLAEGRRYWPRALRSIFESGEKRRLEHLKRKIDAADKEGRSATEHELELRTFPLTKNGGPEVRYPTKLGNLVTAFEEYPLRKYGLDGTFGWYRLWVAADKDLRAELDDHQAVADSGLYVTVALVIGAIACLMYALISLEIPEMFPDLPSPLRLLALGLAAGLLARAVYSATLHAQQQFGELFQAFFDVHIDNFPLEPLVTALAKHHRHLPPEDAREQRAAVVRFLKWHRYRPPAESENIVVTNW